MMKPILYSATEESFDTMGYGVLNECTSCYCEEERNGIFEVTFKYPTNGLLYDKIQEGCYIKVKPNDKQDKQIFKIYGSSKEVKGEQEFYCEHISYKLNKIPVINLDVSTKSAAEAMTQLKEQSLVYNPFSFSSDIESRLSTIITSPVTVRKALGGVDGSILDIWGGEFEWDNYTVILHRMRGEIKDIPIKYGFNLQKLNKKKYIDEVYTAVLPYVTYSNDENESITITLSEKYMTYDEVMPTEVLVYVKDFSELFAENEEKSEEALRAKCSQWMQTNKLYIPRMNLSVEIVKLEQTEQYKDLLKLQTVNLCDYVPIIFEDMSTDSYLQVIKIKYDCILERNDTVELGDEPVTLNNQVRQLSDGVSMAVEKVSKDYIAIVNNSIGLATGNKGGHIVLYPGAKPEELLIMDTDNINTAANIIKGDSNGLGHSNNGYKGTYRNLISIDGKIAGYSVDDKGLYTENLRINKSGEIDCYTWADLFIIEMVVNGIIQETSDLIQRYDFNDDGSITIDDYNALKERLNTL